MRFDRRKQGERNMIYNKHRCTIIDDDGDEYEAIIGEMEIKLCGDRPLVTATMEIYEIAISFKTVSEMKSIDCLNIYVNEDGTVDFTINGVPCKGFHIEEVRTIANESDNFRTTTTHVKFVNDRLAEPRRVKWLLVTDLYTEWVD